MANLTTFFTNKQLHPTKPFNYLINSSFPFHCKSFITSTARYRRKPFKIKCSSSSVKHCSTSDNINMSSEMWAKESEGVQVIGIGSRVDAVLDFCLLHSSTSSHSFRFWSVVKRESLRGELRQRFLREDNYPDFGDTPLNSVSRSKAVVLVASAGYGDDHVLAIEILRAIRSGSGLVVAVVLKPFSFEGQRRQDEVKILTDTLQNCVDFCIDVDIDTLLKMDLVTLDEALKTAYKAVFSAINAVSILVSDSHKKHIHSLHDGMTKITVADIKKVLDSHKEARIGFGIADNVESSIVQAVYDCPFLSVGLKNLDGVVVCVLSSFSALGDDDVCTVLHSFREATECTKEVIISVVRNPDMKPNLIASTVITIGNTEGKSLQKSSILSRLADSIPFVFNFLRRHDVESDNPKESSLRKSIFPPMLANFVDKNEVPDMVPAEEATDSFETYSSNKMFVDENNNMVGNLDALGSSSNYMEPNAQGDQTSGGKPFIDREVRPEYKIVERHEEDWSVSVADNPKIFQLPVGVRLSDDSDDKVDRTTPRRPAEKIIDEDSRMQPSTVPSVSSFNEFADVGFEVVTDILNTASTLLKGKQLDVQKKQGVLSVRAASMLEAERDSKTRWSPVMKIRYRGGIYKGHCQGGLPEGRGRLTFQDGSVYDGMWRYGKRSGLGSLFYSNGDVFHGSWRDDLMHGKGWLYFSTGERWFANFWKGRANGEGRFYSKSGEVFFGQFQDGWRDGQFLCVKDYGRRYVEIWNDGVLISSEELDS